MESRNRARLMLINIGEQSNPKIFERTPPINARSLLKPFVSSYQAQFDFNKILMAL